MLQKVQEATSGLSGYMSGETTNGVAYANGNGNGYANGAALDGQVTSTSSKTSITRTISVQGQSQSQTAVDYVAVGGNPTLTALGI